MNNFQKRALAYRVYRALIKLANVNNSDINNSESLTKTPETSGDDMKVNKNMKQTKGLIRRPWHRRISKGGGCCGK